MNHDLIKEGLGIPSNRRIRITPVSNGFNIRLLNNYLVEEGGQRESCVEGRCDKCGCFGSMHRHHIIPKSAGGKDDPDNQILLCKYDHVGDNGIHFGKWAITDVVCEDKLFELKIRYGVITGEVK